jgi:hypothetical protein
MAARNLLDVLPAYKGSLVVPLVFWIPATITLFVDMVEVAAQVHETLYQPLA